MNDWAAPLEKQIALVEPVRVLEFLGRLAAAGSNRVLPDDDHVGEAPARALRLYGLSLLILDAASGSYEPLSTELLAPELAEMLRGLRANSAASQSYYRFVVGELRAELRKHFPRIGDREFAIRIGGQVVLRPLPPK
jgi:hypothetical protein